MSILIGDLQHSRTDYVRSAYPDLEVIPVSVIDEATLEAFRDAAWRLTGLIRLRLRTVGRTDPEPIALDPGPTVEIWKATTEIHEALEGDEGHAVSGGTASMGAVLAQIIILDIVFSLDSVLTAVGMANDIPVMIAAIVIAVGVMLFASGPISRFVHQHPTVKMLALSFLLLIGVTLIADGAGLHVPKGYIYAAMGFSVLVEMLNLAARRRREGRAISLHPTFVKDEPPAPSSG